MFLITINERSMANCIHGIETLRFVVTLSAKMSHIESLLNSIHDYRQLTPNKEMDINSSPIFRRRALTHPESINQVVN